MELMKMITLMEKLGFYEGPGYFSTDVLDPKDPDNGPFMKIESLATGDLLRSPLESLRFSICVHNNPWCEVQRTTYHSLEECLKKERPASVAILKREYDPLEGLNIPEKGKKKLRKENKRRDELRDAFRKVIRCVAALNFGLEVTT
jgi:hypothetical protein